MDTRTTGGREYSLFPPPLHPIANSVAPKHTRRSFIKSIAWNRQSVAIFADFNDVVSETSSINDGRDSGSESFAGEGLNRSGSVRSYNSNKELPEPPYHVMDLKKKKYLVYLVSLAGLFSPLSSNIYFPALGAIASEFHISFAMVSLTITSYMIVQGLAPSFWGPLADAAGRRIVLIGTLTAYLLANLGLAFSRNFAALMLFRGLQAFGSSSTIAVGAGVIGDITTPAERAGLIGIFGGSSVVRMMGQSFGPVLGGVLTQFLGFRAIFWFLLILGGLTLLTIVLFLPETLRIIAGNGEVAPHGIHRPLIPRVFARDAIVERNSDFKFRFAIASIFQPLKFLLEKDIFVTLFFGSIVYTAWSMVTSTTTNLFQTRYGLNDLTTGLAFLPNGVGCVLGSYVTGVVMDRDYRITESKYREANQLAPNVKISLKNFDSFPIERARLRSVWWIASLFIISLGSYGFSLGRSIALPLTIQFFIGYAATAIFNVNSALVVDLFPGKSASATAVNNLIRCTIGAIGVAFADSLVAALRPPFAFLLLAGITVILSPLLWVEYQWGMKWRRERSSRLELRKWNNEEKRNLK